MRETGAEEGKRAWLDGRVCELEEPEEGVGERLGREEGDGGVYVVLGGLADLVALVITERGRRGRTNVEQAAEELRQRGVDRLRTGGASRVDLAEQLLGLERKAEEAEEVDRRVPGLACRSLAFDRSSLQE